jgi:hypothetical protein
MGNAIAMRAWVVAKAALAAGAGEQFVTDLPLSPGPRIGRNRSLVVLSFNHDPTGHDHAGIEAATQGETPVKRQSREEKRRSAERVETDADARQRPRASSIATPTISRRCFVSPLLMISR